MLNKKIVLGVASSVSIYKALELVRLFQKNGIEVHVVMTPHAAELVSPQLFQAVSLQRVWVRQFDPSSSDPMAHVGALREVDGVVLAPATASLIGRYAMGLATDLLTTLLLAIQKPVVVAPAMNTAMWQHPLVQTNVAMLRDKLGVHFVEPAEGTLACGDVGIGKLADLEAIVWATERALGPNDLSDKTILVTMGRTEEPLDPVRHLTNASSGRMGRALVRSAYVRGAKVVVISGRAEVSLPDLPEIKVMPIRTAAELMKNVQQHFPESDWAVAAAAVSDYRPFSVSSDKLKRSDDPQTMALVSNPDALAWMIAQQVDDQKVVGFALETGDLLSLSRQKREHKGLDWLVANGVDSLGADHAQFLLWRQAEHRSLTGTKLEVADSLWTALSHDALEKNT